MPVLASDRLIDQSSNPFASMAIGEQARADDEYLASSASDSPFAVSVSSSPSLLELAARQAYDVGVAGWPGNRLNTEEFKSVSHSRHRPGQFAKGPYVSFETRGHTPQGGGLYYVPALREAAESFNDAYYLPGPLGGSAL